mgnify:FL=1|tara:strand:+ start:1195 stop:1404 length:210 start_codon:yes stop_codon:yes gene_type:complete
MTNIELQIRSIKAFILKNRNRQRVADMAGLHKNTVAYFLNDKHSITLNNVIAIEKAVQKLIKEKNHGDV